MCQRHQHFFAQQSAAAADFATSAAAPHYAPDLALEPEHLALDLRFDLKARLAAGTATTTVRARHEDARTLVLDAVGLTITEVRCDEAQVSHVHDGQRLTITFADPVPVGQTRRVAVRYEVTDPITGLMFSDAPAFIASDHETQRARHWIPCVDHPAVRTTLEVTLRGPADWHLLGPGVLTVEEAHGDGTKTARWKLDQRCPAYLLCVAMGDFAKSDGGVHRGPDGKDVPLATFCAKADGDKLPRTFGKTKSMMDWMVQRLGRPFPFPKYFQFSVPAIGGAMENVSLVSWDDFALMDERADLDRRLRIDSVNVHEMAHSYFGDAVVIRDYAHAWLKESWASYVESVWVEDTLGKDEADFYRSEEVREYRIEADGRYLRPIVTRKFDSAWDMFDMHLYPGGAARLHMLRRKLGDRAFWEGVRDYLTAFDGKTADTGDFMRCLEARSGLSLQGFFDEWLYAAGYPAVKASFSWDAEKRVATIGFEQTQKDEAKGVGLFTLPVTVALTVGGEIIRRAVTVRDRAELAVPCASRPTSVVIDPDGDLCFSLDWAPGHDLLVAALGAPTVPGRIQAVRALTKKASGAAVAAIETRWPSEPFWGVRVEMARGLSEAGTGPAAAAIARLLGSEPDHRVRIALARAAGSYRDAAIESALVAFLDRDDVKRGSELALAAAFEALGKQRGEAHVARLTAALEIPSWGWIQRGVLAGLSATRSEAALGPVLSALDAGRRRPVRIAAAEALGALGKWLSPSSRLRALDRLVDLSRDADYGTRLAAARGLSTLGAHEASATFDAIERMAAEQDHARIRRAARAARGADPKGGADQKLLARVEELEERLRKLEVR